MAAGHAHVTAEPVRMVVLGMGYAFWESLKGCMQYAEVAEEDEVRMSVEVNQEI
jgi:hypothetical protein